MPEQCPWPSGRLGSSFGLALPRGGRSAALLARGRDKGCPAAHGFSPPSQPGLFPAGGSRDRGTGEWLCARDLDRDRFPFPPEDAGEGKGGKQLASHDPWNTRGLPAGLRLL